MIQDPEDDDENIELENGSSDREDADKWTYEQEMQQQINDENL